MADIKVTTLKNPIGLMVQVPIEDWAQGVAALMAEADKLGIVPESIAPEKISDIGEDTYLSITLWGCRI